MSDEILGIAFYSVCGATLCYLWGSGYKRRADGFDSITRVKELKRLDDLLKEKATDLLVVVSGKVGSAAPFNCKDTGPSSGVVWEKREEMIFEYDKVDDGGVMINTSISDLFQERETPWYLEDTTGRVNVVGAKDAVGFDGTLRKYDLNFPQSIFGIFEMIGKLEKRVPERFVYGRTLNTGTFLTFVAEAGRDEAGNVMIRKPEKGSFAVYPGEGSFDKMVGHIKADAEFYMMFTKIFGTIAVGVAVVYGVGFIRKKVLPFIKMKIELHKRSREANSDSEENDQGED